MQRAREKQQQQQNTWKKMVIWSISNFLHVCRCSSFSFRLIYCMATSFFILNYAALHCIASHHHHHNTTATTTDTLSNVISSANLLCSVTVCVCHATKRLDQKKIERDAKCTNLLAPNEYTLFIFIKSYWWKWYLLKPICQYNNNLWARRFIFIFFYNQYPTTNSQFLSDTLISIVQKE